MYYLIKALAILPLSILFPTRVIGKKNIPHGKAILICNHLSNIDSIYLSYKIWRKEYFLAKKELYKNRIFGAILSFIGAIPIDRDKVDLTAIKKSLNVLKKGKLLTIFPEGTRNKTDRDLLEFKPGASLIAIKSGAPIIPIYITKKPRPFHINKIVIGEPIYFDSSYKGEEGSKIANELMREKMLELKNK